MVASSIGAISRSMWLLSHNKFVFPNPKSNTRNTAYFPEKIRIPSNNNVLLQKFTTSFSTKAAAFSVGNTEYAEEPATNVKFQTSLNLPGCSSPLSLIGTGFREKKFAIIGVKVYAAGLYIDPAILDKLQAWKGKTASDIQDDSSLFDLVYQASLEKSLQIVLVRDVDGKTFWDAVDEAISPIMKSPTSVDEIALATFRGTFQGRSLKKGTLIFLTWVDPSKMLIHLSAEGIPSAAEATIESQNVTRSLFDIFFGRAPVSPTLKSSVCNALTSALKRTRLSVTQ